MSRLLSILDPLFDILQKVFGFVVNWVFVPVLELILVPVIRILVELFKFIFGLLFYNVGKFLLALIDFVNNLFRVLCGLESNVMTISLGENGGTGDILVQVIRSSEIQQAFISMCIVGLFLLLITSVFQIIKTEYTTEGAKNSKTPILQKAFKSLANLMLLPLLVVFGILIANGVLGILDRATSAEGENPTVSGLLFVTAASEAHLPKDNLSVSLISDNLIDNLSHVLSDAVESAIEIADKDDEYESAIPGADDMEYLYSESERRDIEDNFINQREGYKYYRVNDMCKYYAYTEINYLLLILGGVIILKCFFFTCFGLIIRLYKCAVLFIISPVVIGMTPINEGGLGKWRTSFIGQVLSAYGTVLSINIFMIVVRVLINIELDLTSNDFMFDGPFMTFLLKAIIVMAGCLMIEKFSKEIGGYFSAEDAMSAGAGMAKEVGSTAMKAVGTTAMIAGGGAMLAGKAIGGIAKHLPKNEQKQAGKSAYKAALAEGKTKDEAKQAQKDAITKFNDDKKAKEARGERQKGAASRQVEFAELEKHAKGKVDDANKWLDGNAKYEQAQLDMEAYDKAFNTFEANKQFADDGKKKQKMQETRAKGVTGVIKDDYGKGKLIEEVNQDQKDAAEIAKEKEDKINEERKERAEKRASRQRFGMNIVSGLTGMAQEQVEKIPGAGLRKTWEKHQDSGAKRLGDDFSASLESSRKKAEGKRQDSVVDNALLHGMIQNQRNTAIMNTSQQFVKDLKFESSNLERQLAKVFEDALKTTRGSNYASYSEGERAQFENSKAAELRSLGSKLSNDEVSKLLNDVTINSAQQVDFKFDFDVKAIEEAVNKAIRDGGTNEALQNNLLAAIKKQTQEGNTLVAKKIEELFKKLQSELGGK